MAIAISPLDLLLDTENPRFVILQSREQADIRKYLVTYEDVCQLATDINTYGRLLPGGELLLCMKAISMLWLRAIAVHVRSKCC